jgi:TetR/AcrR family transcriptional repressor of mexJK operon
MARRALMPRVVGQIDRAKNEAILDAASDVIFERGLVAPLGEIARRANVSKQTIYNHYGSKTALLRALIERRTREIIAPLEVADTTPEAALAAYARGLLATVTMERGTALLRLLIGAAPHDPEMSRTVFARGARASRIKLAEYLARESKAGRLAIPDPTEAAGFFAGMVIGHHQLQGLLGLPQDLTAEAIERIATEAAKRFMRAYRA